MQFKVVNKRTGVQSTVKANAPEAAKKKAAFLGRNEDLVAYRTSVYGTLKERFIIWGQKDDKTKPGRPGKVQLRTHFSY